MYFPPIVLGTVLLSWSYSPREKAGAQAVNDVCVFGISSLIALLSGLVSAATNRWLFPSIIHWIEVINDWLVDFQVLNDFGWAAVLYSVLIIYCVGMATALITLRVYKDSWVETTATKSIEMHWHANCSSQSYPKTCKDSFRVYIVLQVPSYQFHRKL